MNVFTRQKHTQNVSFHAIDNLYTYKHDALVLLPHFPYFLRTVIQSWFFFSMDFNRVHVSHLVDRYSRSIFFFFLMWKPVIFSPSEHPTLCFFLFSD